MEFNAQLEAALNAEFIISENLREDIYSTIAELNKLTKSSTAVETISKDNEDLQHNEIEAEMNSVSTDHNHAVVEDDFDNMTIVNNDKLEINCFPTSSMNGLHTENIPQISASKLAYLNHGDLLRKYSGI